MIADMVNGSFELFGAWAAWLNVRLIRRDKCVQGFDYRSTIFYISWGIWNLYYYPSLGQWWSFLGGVLIITVNVIWLCHVFYYKRNKYGKI